MSSLPLLTTRGRGGKSPENLGLLIRIEFIWMIILFWGGLNLPFSWIIAGRMVNPIRKHAIHFCFPLKRTIYTTLGSIDLCHIHIFNAPWNSRSACHTQNLRTIPNKEFTKAAAFVHEIYLKNVNVKVLMDNSRPFTFDIWEKEKHMGVLRLTMRGCITLKQPCHLILYIT